MEFADPVGVVDGKASIGIDAALSDGAQILGKVTDAGTGAPVEHVAVIASEVVSHATSRACTAADGTYAVLALPGGVYAVGFVSDGSCGAVAPYATQYYKDADKAQAASPVNVAPGSITTHVDGHLHMASDSPTPTPTASPSPSPTASPRCRVRASAKVRRGKLTVGITCDQPARLALTGRVKVKRTTLRLKGVKVTAAVRTVRVALPARARRALRKHKKVSATFALVASNANGTTRATARVARLKR
jgi:hypothetical protein